MISFHLKIVVILSFTTLLSGCKDGLLLAAVIIGLLNLDPKEDSENAIENCEHPVQSNSEALFVANRISDTIEYEIEQLDSGIYSEEKVFCYSGSMTLSGVLSRTKDESCGVGCTRSYNDHDVIASLSDCIYIHPTNYTWRYSITGDIVLSNSMGIERHDDGTTKLFGDYMITDNGTEIEFEANGYHCDNTMGEIVDTITLLNAYEPANYISRHSLWDTVNFTGKAGTYLYSLH